MINTKDRSLGRIRARLTILASEFYGLTEEPVSIFPSRFFAISNLRLNYLGESWFL